MAGRATARRVTMTPTTTKAARARAAPVLSRFSCNGVLPVSTVCKHLGNLAELGVHACGNDHRATPPISRRLCRHKPCSCGHPMPIHDSLSGAVCFSTGTDSPVRAASSICRLIGFHQSGVGGNFVASVARGSHRQARGHEPGYLNLLPIPQNGGRGGSHLP